MNALNLLIGKAYAATDTVMPAAPTPGGALPPEAPSNAQTFGLQAGFTLLMIVGFFLVFIVPQQKRFKKHKAMIEGMKPGDKVLTAGGFVGTIDKIEAGNEEVVIDLGGGTKVTALRSTIQSRADRVDVTKDAGKKA